VLFDTEGLVAEYVEIDSDECLSRYGVKVTNPGNWEEIRSVISQISTLTGARDFVILGGKRVFPRPFTDVSAVMSEGRDQNSSVELIISDAWYVDFNNDRIVDNGYVVSRFPDLGYECNAVERGLQTAIELHTAGGFTLDRTVRFSINDYTTPPYGVCSACSLRSEFFELVSNSDYVIFTGHGTRTSFFNNNYEAIFTVHYMGSVNLQTFHPVVIGYFSCNTGQLDLDSPTFSSEFSKNGASAFVARTTTHGVPAHVANEFHAGIMSGERIGAALFRTMRETVLIWGDSFKAAAGHLVLYGDPTLLRRIPEPQDFTGTYTTSSDELLLQWRYSPAVDLSHYTIHRGVGPDFVPSEINRLAETADTVITLTGVPPEDPWYLKLAAVNLHGNISNYLVLAPQDVTVPTLVVDYRVNSHGGYAEVTWTLTTDTANLEFEVARKESSESSFTIISGSLSRNGNTYSFRDASIQHGRAYIYLVSIIESDKVVASFTADLNIPPLGLTLHQNYPNPFNLLTTIPFTVPETARVTLSIYDTGGRLVGILVDETLRDGLREITWDGTDSHGNSVSSGVYFYRLIAGGKTFTKKMVLLK
jgi:hypothetical protein